MSLSAKNNIYIFSFFLLLLVAIFNKSNSIQTSSHITSKCGLLQVNNDIGFYSFQSLLYTKETIQAESSSPQCSQHSHGVPPYLIPSSSNVSFSSLHLKYLFKLITCIRYCVILNIRRHISPYLITSMILWLLPKHLFCLTLEWKNRRII